MLNSEISPSKDNLIFSSIEDIHIHTVVDVDISSNKPEHVKNASRNNSLNKVKAKDHQEIANAKRQQNLLLVQQQAAMVAKDGKGDENVIEFHSHHSSPKGNKIEVEEEGQTDLEEYDNGPEIVPVDEEIERRTTCCNLFGFGVS